MDKKSLGISFLIIVILFIIYFPLSSGLNSPYLLDDLPNLRYLFNLGDRPEYFWQEVMANRSGAFGRPVSIFSFALDFFVYIPDQTESIKRTSLLLHLIIFCISLLLFLRLTLTKIPAGIILVAGFIWVSLAIHSSTVFYLVQRMAMLSTFFILCSSLMYVYWRFENRFIFKLCYLGLFIVFALLAIFSKENGLLVFPLVFLIECVFFRFDGLLNKQKPFFYMALMVMAIGLIYFVYKFLPDFNVKSSIGLTPWERLITETRILWVYLERILIPNFQIGIFQDGFPPSKSLLKPISTLYSFFAILILLLLALFLWFKNKCQWLVFAILWFYISHSLESTILPLELVFEHRNYLASVGLVFGLVVQLWIWLEKYLEELPFFLLLGSYAAFQLLYFSIIAAMYTNPTLYYMNAYHEHPQSERAAFGWARQIAKVGEIEGLYEVVVTKSVGESGRLPQLYLAMALYCESGAELPASYFDALDKALWELGDFSQKRVSTDLMVLSQGYIQKGKCDREDVKQFANHLYSYLSTHKFLTHRIALMELSELESYLGNIEKALEYAEVLADRDPLYLDAILLVMMYSKASDNKKYLEHEQLFLKSIESVVPRLDQQEAYQYISGRKLNVH